MSQLSELLHEAVPEPPPLAGLARDAESRARRTRRRRRAGASATLVVAVAVVAAVAAVGPRHGPGEASGPATTATGSCAVTPGTTPHAGLTYVRFCPVPTPLDHGLLPALVPDVTLTTHLSDVATLFHGPDVSCNQTLAGPFRVVAGYADGTVDELATCGDDYAVLMRAIAEQQSADEPARTPPATVNPMGAECEVTTKVASLASSSLLSQPAAYGYVCEESGRSLGPPSAVPLSGSEAEEVRLRVLAQGGATVGRCGDAASRDATIDYVLVLADGSTHDVATDLDACGLTIDGVRAGVPSVALYDRVPSVPG